MLKSDDTSKGICGRGVGENVFPFVTVLRCKLSS